MLNAQDAMEDGGIVEIVTERRKRNIRISIKDNGKGISGNDIDHIFDPFFTTKSTSLGTGLGLSISKGIIDSFGGKLEVKGPEGKGTTFTIIFPTV